MLRNAALLVALLAASAVWAVPVRTAATRHAKATAGHAVHVIVIDKMQYGPMPADVRVGDIIEWTNHDIFEHSATARDGSFDIDLQPGASGRITAKAGTVTFFCKFHPGMTATLAVR
ncbi:MAG: cupredoxin domain-containing protein [Rhodanobacter sp.]